MTDYLPTNQTEKQTGEYETIGARIGRLVDEKQRAYGDSFNRSIKIIEELYPCGIRPAQYGDLLALIRVIDKIFRIVTSGSGSDLMDENPWQDIAGYGVLKCRTK